MEMDLPSNKAWDERKRGEVHRLVVGGVEVVASDGHSILSLLGQIYCSRTMEADSYFERVIQM